MKRLCLINVAALSNRIMDLAPQGGALRRLASGGRRSLRPVCPAVTCTMQATLTTGAPPGGHGIIANGLHFADRGLVSFWEQSSRLLDVPRFWRRKRLSGLRTAMLFWQNSMFGAADVTLTPRPVHTPDGRTVSSCYSDPPDLYDRLAVELGAFELKHYWGPFAALPASDWIAHSAVRVWASERPDLLLVYLPHMDYCLQKVGPADASIAAEAAALDALVGRIAGAVEADGGRVVVAGDYGIVPVSRPVMPNVALRQAGLLPVRNVAGSECIEVGEARAFAMVDHQVAHIYTADPSCMDAARGVLADLPGVAEVIDLAEDDRFALRHRRSGQLVALAEPDAWFAYYWWTDAAAAPPFARTVDIHRKPGYDPCELFIDPAARAISLDATRVRGSHGLPPAAPADMPVLLASTPLPTNSETVDATEVAGLLEQLILA
ncbi:MAG: hypothetical protein BIFFINMI_01221 [Phycisphaerae bacterium]|nr:hypothetical protein [Phycisphaerae bacterium]